MDLTELLEELLVDAYGEAEQLTAFECGIQSADVLPCPAMVLGESVVWTDVEFDGNPLRGLVAKCRKPGGKIYSIQLADLEVDRSEPGAPYVAAYRQWMGLPPRLTATNTSGDMVEVLVTAVMSRMARVRTMDGESLILRPKQIQLLVPGQLLKVVPAKRWRNQGRDYLSGEVGSISIDPERMGIEPIPIDELGPCTPPDQDDVEAVHPDVQALIRTGPQPAIELAGSRPVDPDEDPILEAVSLREAGDLEGARRVLGRLVERDLRCLDAHAHLGNLDFDLLPERALAHFEVGVRIAEWSIGEGFEGYALWGFIDNRPYLRCLHGYGLTLWRLGRFEEAGEALSRLLVLNPVDNQGVRFVLPQVWSREPWRDN